MVVLGAEVKPSVTSSPHFLLTDPRDFCGRAMRAGLPGLGSGARGQEGKLRARGQAPVLQIYHTVLPKVATQVVGIPSYYPYYI